MIFALDFRVSYRMNTDHRRVINVARSQHVEKELN
jgi:hypothetical protein